MDIFGRENYAHLQAMNDPDTYLRRRAQRYGHERLDFNALDPDNMGRMRDAVSGAATASWLQTNLESMDAVVEEKLYQDYPIARFVPINTAMPEGTQVVPLRVRDYAGEAVESDEYGAGAGRVRMSYDHVGIPVRALHATAEISDDSILTTSMLGIPLDADTFDAVVTVHMDSASDTLFTGRRPGRRGLLNQQSASSVTDDRVTNITAPATFAAMTAQQWETTIQQGISLVMTATGGLAGTRMSGMLNVVVPTSAAVKLAEMRIANTDASTWEYVMRNNAWTAAAPGNSVQLLTSEYCLASSGGHLSKDRIAIFPMNERCLVMYEVMRPRITEIVREPFGYVMPVMSKYSEIHVRRENAMVYITSA